MKLTHKQIDLLLACLEDCANSDSWEHMKDELYNLYDTLTDNAQ